MNPDAITAPAGVKRIIHFHDLGKRDYQETWDLQERYFAETVRRKFLNRTRPADDQIATEDHLFFVEHPPVFTLGKSGDPGNLLLDESELKQREIGFYPINRGGDITFHGPGQIVGYPIFDLEHFFTDIHRYLRYLEEAIILTCAEYSVHCGRIDGLTGVWIDGDQPTRARKIAALGVKCSRWVTMHGFAFNVNTDLSYFGHIVPCGITDKSVTSLHLELGAPVDFEECKQRLKKHIAAVFDAQLMD
ncbi:MAG: lipoyl(octanoyl) transferase LipB [Bacteroidota bacterium]|jgi:lipoyl(octanoyl) transferase